MYHIKGSIEGLAPLLFNGWTEQAMKDLDASVTGGKKTPIQKEEAADLKAYRNGQGLYIPAANLKKCILEGAGIAGLKDGKRSLVPYLRAEIFFTDREISLNQKNYDSIHVCVGRVPPGPKGKAAVLRRPMLNIGWTLGFTMAVISDRRTPDQIRQAVESAGLYIGLGDWRPEYGRFSLTEWEKA